MMVLRLKQASFDAKSQLPNAQAEAVQFYPFQEVFALRAESGLQSLSYCFPAMFIPRDNVHLCGAGNAFGNSAYPFRKDGCTPGRKS